MTIATARTYLARLTKSGADTDRYSQLDNELALATLGHRLVNTLSPITKQTVAITADTEQATFSGITSFRPERFYRGRVTVNSDTDHHYTDCATRYGLRLVDYETVRQWQGRHPCRQSYNCGVPAFIGFDTAGIGNLFPTPKYTGTIDVWTRDLFVAFTPGSGSTEVINIPDDFIYDWLEAVADYIQLDDAEARKEYVKGGDWADLLNRARGVMALTGKELIND